MKLPITKYTIQLIYKCPHCNQTVTIELDPYDFNYHVKEHKLFYISELNLEVKDCIHCGNSFEDINLR